MTCKPARCSRRPSIRARRPPTSQRQPQRPAPPPGSPVDAPGRVAVVAPSAHRSHAWLPTWPVSRKGRVKRIMRPSTLLECRPPPLGKLPFGFHSASNTAEARGRRPAPKRYPCLPPQRVAMPCARARAWLVSGATRSLAQGRGHPDRHDCSLHCRGHSGTGRTPPRAAGPRTPRHGGTIPLRTCAWRAHSLWDPNCHPR